MKFQAIHRLTISLIAVGMGSMLACSNQSDEDLLAPTPRPSASVAGTVGEVAGNLGGTTTDALQDALGTLDRLAQCLPLPLRVESRVIGPQGGRISVGSYQLKVPAGALDRNVLITMQQVSGPVNSVRFAPEGLRFARTATLAMSYRNCQANPTGGANRILYVDERLQAQEAPPSVDNRAEQTVSAEIGHFSRYAIAW